MENQNVARTLENDGWNRDGFALTEGGIVISYGDGSIEISFSRQSFALDTMPDEAADDYRRALRSVLLRHAADDVLTYDVGVTLEWGKLRQPT